MNYRETDSGDRQPGRSLAVAALWLAVAAPLAGRPAPTPSPLQVHERLRSQLHQGQDVSAAVAEWTRETGDHSFDGLSRFSPLNREALSKQLEALAHWDGGRLQEALETYQRAASIAEAADNPTEAVFCGYYEAEILAQQNRYAESLSRIDRALAGASRNPSPKPYLEALLLQSRGYALWLMDQLPASIQAFGEAQRRWSRLHFPHATAANWNNLAGLHEDLGFAARAESCYRMALETADRDVFPEIRLQIHANFSLFLLDQGRRREALEQFELARHWEAANPFEFLLLRRRLFRDDDSKRRLQSLPAPTESDRIERLLALAETEDDFESAAELFREVLKRSRRGPHQRWHRLAARKLGRLYEARGDFPQAAELYRLALRRQEEWNRTEIIFPYSRVSNAAFDGWVRCLVALGRPRLAWSEIQKRLARSRSRARSLMNSPPGATSPEDPIDRFVEAVKLDAAADGGPPVLGPPPSLPSIPKPRGHCTLEMWPDQSRIFVWIANRAGFHFRVLDMGRPVSDSVSEVVDAFFQAVESLPPRPDERALRRLHRRMLQPLLPLLDSRNLLFVGHKELESLPIEMLLDEDGRFLLESFNVSYLPQARPETRLLTADGRPLVVLPDSSRLSGALRERQFFRENFPDARLANRLETLEDARARWIHVSSHLDLEPDLWIASSIAGGWSLSSLLRPRFSCRLLSLGVCDGGNSHRWGSPYWLNLAELLLTRKIEALLVSRWKMDELSSRIFLDFYRLCKTGLPMDQALTEARRGFLRTKLERGDASAPGEHPFFWAGISYVGPPGLRLYPEAEVSPTVLWLAPLAALALLVAWRGRLRHCR